MKTLTVHAEISIRKPVAPVFRAVLNPKPFFLHTTSGPLKAGTSTQWEFIEMPGQGFPVKATKVRRNKLIRFSWPRDDKNNMNTVTFRFKPYSKSITTVYVTESGWPMTAKSRAASYQNCMGWTHMICSLKAYLEHRVNLRDKAFVHMKF